MVDRTKIITLREGLLTLGESVLQAAHTTKPYIDVVLRPAALVGGTLTAYALGGYEFVKQLPSGSLEQIAYSAAGGAGGLALGIGGYFAGRALGKRAIARVHHQQATRTAGRVYREGILPWGATIALGAFAFFSPLAGEAVNMVLEKSHLQGYSSVELSKPVERAIGPAAVPLQKQADGSFALPSSLTSLSDLESRIDQPHLSDYQFPEDMAYPVDGSHEITSPVMAHRKNPLTGKMQPHNGTDIGCPEGTKVQAVMDGIVLNITKDHPTYGNTITLQHFTEDQSGGQITRYHHLQSMKKKVDDAVSQGEVIGLSGKTGSVTGPHLHFTYEENKIAKNPLLPPEAMAGISPVYRALLDTIALAEWESTDAQYYTTMLGNKGDESFSSLLTHPGKNADDLAGRYLFSLENYTALQNKGLFTSGFHPWEQDRAAVYLLQQHEVTPSDVLTAVSDEKKFNEIGKKLCQAGWSGFSFHESCKADPVPNGLYEQFQILANKYSINSP